MRYFVSFIFFIPFIGLGQNDFESRYFTLAASVNTELPTPELSAFQKKVANTIYKKSQFSDFTNQQVTRQNFWQPVDMALTANERQGFSNVSTERLQAGFDRAQLYGYTTDGKTKTRNEVYLDQQYYSPIFNPNRSFYRNRNYSPYNYPRRRRNAVLIFGNNN